MPIRVKLPLLHARPPSFSIQSTLPVNRNILLIGKLISNFLPLVGQNWLCWNLTEKHSIALKKCWLSVVWNWTAYLPPWKYPASGRKYKQGTLWRTPSFQFANQLPSPFLNLPKSGGRKRRESTRIWEWLGSAAIFIQNQNRSQLKGMSSQIVFAANSRKRELVLRRGGRYQDPSEFQGRFCAQSSLSYVEVKYFILWFVKTSTEY